MNHVILPSPCRTQPCLAHLSVARGGRKQEMYVCCNVMLPSTPSIITWYIVHDSDHNLKLVKSQRTGQLLKLQFCLFTFLVPKQKTKLKSQLLKYLWLLENHCSVITTNKQLIILGKNQSFFFKTNKQIWSLQDQARNKIYLKMHHSSTFRTWVLTI